MSMNTWNGIGRLTRDGELRYSQSGKAIFSFSIAVDRDFKNANGERDADFINCVAFGSLGELCSQYTSKGMQVGVRGRLQSRTYENNEGKKVYTTEIVCESVQFLSNNRNGQTQQNDPFSNQGQTIEIDDLPFG